MRGKAFFQSFLAAVIVEAIIVLLAHFLGYYQFDFENVITWSVMVAVVIVSGLIGMIIACIQNAAKKGKTKRHKEQIGGMK